MANTSIATYSYARSAPAANRSGGAPQSSGRDSNVEYEGVQPVYLVPQGRFSKRRLADGTDILICTDGIYAYQRRPKEDVLLELRGQNAVVFGSLARLVGTPNEPAPAEPILGEVITGVYLERDIVLQAGPYKITAEKLYYDFTQNRALILDAVLRLKLPDPSLPLQVRAEQIRQLSSSRFAARQLKLSTDEFYLPHTWLGAKEARITTELVEDKGLTALAGARSCYELRDVTVNLEEVPIFWWPRAAGTTTKTELPIKTLHTSHSSEYGFGIESRWNLAWLLGLAEPSGVESTLLLDEFTERGPATGIELDYSSRDYFGKLGSYLVSDEGEDKLGSFFSRRDLEPEHTLRGRAKWQHRHYLPYDWEGTFEISYLSDAHFLENWQEREFDTAKEQETLIYLKRQRDNWAFDLLNKFHLNDFGYTMTELPTAGLHIVGQDLFETFTYYHDGYISRLRERAEDNRVSGLTGRYEQSNLPSLIDQDDFAFGLSRHELALPMQLGPFNVSPTAIGSFAYDDSEEDETTVQGAFGLRGGTQLWHIDDSVQSRLWDLDRIRHIVMPEVSAFWLESDQEETNQNHLLNFSLKQRWQTMRGLQGDKHSVDFLRFDAGLTLVNHDVDDCDLPNKFFFSTPEPQLDPAAFLNADLVNFDLARREQINQNLSDHVTADSTWRISEETVVTGRVNYNLNDSVLSQAGANIAVQRSPRTSYYVGNRYLHGGDPFQLEDSHFLTAGVSYKLNRKYTFAATHQYDIEQTADSYTQAVIIRKFVHWYGAFSVSHDADRDSFSFQVSFWPEGLERFALGSRRFARLTR